LRVSQPSILRQQGKKRRKRRKRKKRKLESLPFDD
jgi:hypothetical protein